MKSTFPIMLIEDDVVDVKTIQRAFARQGISNPLFVLPNGKEALDYLNRTGRYSDAADTPWPGLILLDLNMPIMSGHEFLEVIKQDQVMRMIPTVVLSTSSEPADVDHSYRLGVAGYMVKPLDFDRFLDVVQVLYAYWKSCETPEPAR